MPGGAALLAAPVAGGRGDQGWTLRGLTFWQPKGLSKPFRKLNR